VVACGAAIQGSVLAGESNQDIVLLDVTSLTFGIETEGSIMTPIIERNTTIPCKKSQVFSTAADNQTQVHIRIFQGERTLVADNKLLGEFVLDGIPSARRGTPQIEVTFNIDSNGILNVSAVDKASNKEQSVQIRSSGGLSKEEIEQMIKDAEAYSEEDKKKRELIEKKNQLESLIHSVNTNLEEHKDKLSEEEAKNIQDAIERAKQIQSNEDVSVLTSAIDDLTKNSMKLGEILYKDKQNNSGSSDSHNDSNQSDANPDVVDIE